MNYDAWFTPSATWSAFGGFIGGIVLLWALGFRRKK